MNKVGAIPLTVFYMFCIGSCCSYQSIIFFNNSDVDVRVSAGVGREYDVVAGHFAKISLPWSDAIYINVTDLDRDRELKYEFYPLSEAYVYSCGYQLQFESDRKIYAVKHGIGMPLEAMKLREQPPGYPLTRKEEKGSG